MIARADLLVDLQKLLPSLEDDLRERAALPGIEQQLRASTDPVLLVDAGLLARYDRVDVLERLRDAAGRPNQLPLCWLLVPTDEQLARPTLNQAVIPLLNPAQWARVPGAWVEAC